MTSRYGAPYGAPNDYCVSVCGSCLEGEGRAAVTGSSDDNYRFMSEHARRCVARRLCIDATSLIALVIQTTVDRTAWATAGEARAEGADATHVTPPPREHIAKRTPKNNPHLFM